VLALKSPLFGSRLRIGIFAPYDLARAGGVATHVRAQARALRDIGHDVSVYGPASAPLEGGETPLCGAVAVRFEGTESGLALDPRAAWRVAQLFASHDFDLVHVHEPLVPLLPWLVLRQARAPVVATFHVHRETGHRWYPAARPVLRLLMRRIRCRIAVSEPARRTVARHFPGAYRIVPNGIALDLFRIVRPRPSAFASGGVCVVSVGRLESRKGVDHLLRGMARVQRALPDSKVVLVGDGPERPALVALARSLFVNATFAGFVPDAQIPAYMQAADIVCAPAIGGESFGLVLLEAMACGKPVVASRIEAYEALVTGDGCGLLVPPGDAEGLAGAILTLAADPALRDTLGRRGAEAARRYDWASIARTLDEIYRTALSADPHPPGANECVSS
jgi:phosphatidylinositol alpha-mannosyltransferase